MKSGKVSDTVLRRTVLQEVQKVNLSNPSPKVGSGAADVPETKFRSAMQTVIGEGVYTAYLAAVRAANSLAAAGAKAQFASLAITVPESMDERVLRKVLEKYGDYCKRSEIRILGGHTAVSAAVSEPVASIQMLGVAEEDTDSAEKINGECTDGETQKDYIGMDVVMTKYCGLGGTALIAGHCKKELEKHYQKRFIARAAAMLTEPEKNTECRIARLGGAVYAHAAAEGGIFGALWEMAEFAECGLEIDLRKIPIRQETVEICEVFDINPYQLRTEGCFLFLTPHGARLCDKLAENGIPAAVIGKTVTGLDRAVKNEEEVRYLEPNRVEEYERLRGNKEVFEQYTEEEKEDA